MKCDECGAKMYLSSKGWECSNPRCGKIEDAVLITDEEWAEQMRWQ